MSTKNPPIRVRRSKIHGTGVYAARRIRKEEEIIYYEGKLITHKEAEKEEDNGHTFLFTLNRKWVIEAAINGSDAKWINHSCDPNCEAMLVEDDDGDRSKDKIVIQAMRTIQPGEELTYDYNIVTDEPIDAKMKSMWKCLCGAENCRGIIVKPARKRKKKASKAVRRSKSGKSGRNGQSRTSARQGIRGR